MGEPRGPAVTRLAVAAVGCLVALWVRDQLDDRMTAQRPPAMRRER